MSVLVAVLVIGGGIMAVKAATPAQPVNTGAKSITLSFTAFSEIMATQIIKEEGSSFSQTKLTQIIEKIIKSFNNNSAVFSCATGQPVGFGGMGCKDSGGVVSYNGTVTGASCNWNSSSGGFAGYWGWSYSVDCPAGSSYR